MLTEESSSLRVQCRLKSGAHLDLEVLDLSLCGCMVDRRAWSAAPEERVLVKLPGLSLQPAAVIWIEDERAGILFEQPLNEAVFEHLQRQIGQELQRSA